MASFESLLADQASRARSGPIFENSLISYRSSLGLFRLRARTDTKALNDGVGHARKMPLKANEKFSMTGDYDKPPLSAHTTHDLPRSLVGIHAEPIRNRIRGVLGQPADVVHLADLGMNKAGRHQGDGNATRSEFVTEAVRQCQNSRLAHAIG